MRTLLLLVSAVAALAVSVPAALATSASGTSPDGSITVNVSLSDTATAGQPFTISESITNNTGRAKLVRVTQMLSGPDGVIFSIRYPLIIPANRTLAFSITYTFPANVPPGTYSLTLAAGGASATADTVVSSA
jgi:uncharacterized membrane protein